MTAVVSTGGEKIWRSAQFSPTFFAKCTNAGVVETKKPPLAYTRGGFGVPLDILHNRLGGGTQGGLAGGGSLGGLTDGGDVALDLGLGAGGTDD